MNRTPLPSMLIFKNDLDGGIYYSFNGTTHRIFETDEIYKIQSISGLLPFKASQVKSTLTEKLQVVKSTPQEYFFKIIQVEKQPVIPKSAKPFTGFHGFSNITVGPTAPSNPRINDLWIDTQSQ